MAKCKCKYYLRDKDGRIVCSVCGKPAHGESELEDKIQTGHETKGTPEAPLYISDKDKAAQETNSSKPERPAVTTRPPFRKF